MKRAFDFVVATAVGGLLILLPLLLLQVMLKDVFQMLVALGTPIADLLPNGWTQNVNAPAALAVLLIFGASFVIGLMTRTRVGRACGHWLERNTVGRIPLYGVVKGLTDRLADMAEGAAFRPALFDMGDAQRQFAYLIEDHGDGLATIMLPHAPSPLSGVVKIAPMARLTMLDASLGDVTKVLSHWGNGAQGLMAPRHRR